MLFNSFEFLIFLPIVFVLYWFVTHQRLTIQNILLVAASYVFYGWWDYRFLGLIIISTFVDFFSGRYIRRWAGTGRSRFFLALSILANLGILGFFKYFNFFIDSLVAISGRFGYQPNLWSLQIILPVGISFYTFQTMSYSIDVFRGKLEPTEDFIAFAAYVSFFPQLVAGPIERATNLLPQFQKGRTFDYSSAVDGLRQILWGYLKKIVIADRCAVYANIIFQDYADYPGSTLLLGAVFFAFQIYGDFSGYSDIAIGTARLFGFNLMKNFAYPYFSRDIAEFWRRWHISLSTWFRDYLYIPLGGSRSNRLTQVRNTLLIFTVSGLWHGANWTFVLWGILNAVFFLPLQLGNRNRRNTDIVAKGRLLPTWTELCTILLTFGLTLVAWIMFRSGSVSDALSYYAGLFSRSLLSVPDFPYRKRALTTAVLIAAFVLVEWIGREREFAIQGIGALNKPFFRYGAYYAIMLTIVFLGVFEENQFIYFQF